MNDDTKKEKDRFQYLKLNYVRTDDVNEKREKRKNIVAEFLKVDIKKRNEIKEIIYPVLRDDIGEKLEDQDFLGAIKAFDFIKNTQRFKEEPKENLVIINNKLIKANLFIYLESKKTDERLKKKIQYLFDEQEKLFKSSDFTGTQYENEYKKIEENRLIFKSIEEDTFWTEISFSVPFPLGITEDAVDITVNGTKIVLKTEKFQFGQTVFGVDNGVVEMSFDKYGLLTRTNIVLRINQYLSEKQYKIYHFGESENRSELQIRSLEVLNKIISRYRLIENNYWIDEVDIRMIDMNSVQFYAGEISVRNIIIQSENTFLHSNKFKYLSEKDQFNLINLLHEKNDLVLWRELLADAKKYLLINKFRESIISLNSAFENFFYSTMKKILFAYENENLVDEFFQGELNYENFDKKDVLDEATFEKLKLMGLLQNGVPSVYKVVKRYYNVVPEKDRIDWSKRYFINSINKIRKYRNDIVHGNMSVTLTDKHVFEAINEFQEMSKKIESMHIYNHKKKSKDDVN